VLVSVLFVPRHIDEIVWSCKRNGCYFTWKRNRDCHTLGCMTYFMLSSVLTVLALNAPYYVLMLMSPLTMNLNQIDLFHSRCLSSCFCRVLLRSSALSARVLSFDECVCTLHSWYSERIRGYLRLCFYCSTEWSECPGSVADIVIRQQAGWQRNHGSIFSKDQGIISAAPRTSYNSGYRGLFLGGGGGGGGVTCAWTG
jgi:hypothetical protein